MKLVIYSEDGLSNRYVKTLLAARDIIEQYVQSYWRIQIETHKRFMKPNPRTFLQNVANLINSPVWAKSDLTIMEGTLVGVFLDISGLRKEFLKFGSLAKPRILPGYVIFFFKII